jgi:hypothetical protein
VKNTARSSFNLGTRSRMIFRGRPSRTRGRSRASGSHIAAEKYRSGCDWPLRTCRPGRRPTASVGQVGVLAAVGRLILGRNSGPGKHEVAPLQVSRLVAMVMSTRCGSVPVKVSSLS